MTIRWQIDAILHFCPEASLMPHHISFSKVAPYLGSPALPSLGWDPSQDFSTFWVQQLKWKAQKPRSKYCKHWVAIINQQPFPTLSMFVLAILLQDCVDALFGGFGRIMFVVELLSDRIGCLTKTLQNRGTSLQCLAGHDDIITICLSWKQTLTVELLMLGGWFCKRSHIVFVHYFVHKMINVCQFWYQHIVPSIYWDSSSNKRTQPHDAQPEQANKQPNTCFLGLASSTNFLVHSRNEYLHVFTVEANIQIQERTFRISPAALNKL